MRFERHHLTLNNPQPFAGLPKGARLLPHQLVEARLDRAPPELVLDTGEVLFVSALDRPWVGLFCRAHAIPCVRRVDVWSLLAEPFLDTEQTATDEAHTSAALVQTGFSREEIEAWRRKIGPAMLRFTARTWEWVHYSHQDVLLAMKGLRARSAFARESMAVAARGALLTDPPIALPTRLRWRWGDLGTTLKIPFGQEASLGEQVLAAWSAPHRHYHGLRHLEHITDRVQALGARSPEQPALLAAAWFHDLVYEPGRADNEARSAELLSTQLGPLGVDPALLVRAAALVLRTAAPFSPAGPTEERFVDADLSILGEDHETYATYARDVRAENPHLPDAIFEAGRGAFLDRVLAHIDATGHLFHHLPPLCEALAAENLQRERATLSL